MIWQRYVELEPIHRLRNEGRELLGKQICITEKRDGENVSTWIDDEGISHISSHNNQVADSDITLRFMETLEYKRASNLVMDQKVEYRSNFILYGELLKRVSPTRLEPKRKRLHWVLFDILDMDTNKFLPYTQLYQHAFHYKIPVVSLIGVYVPKTMFELESMISVSLTWCGRHRREGIVGKVYQGEQIFFKEKRDIPKAIKIPRENQVHIEYPDMPEDRILRAFQHAWDECLANGWDWKDKSKTMPTIVKHINVEAEEHNFAPPRNIYNLYLSIPIEKINEGKQN